MRQSSPRSVASDRCLAAYTPHWNSQVGHCWPRSEDPLSAHCAPVYHEIQIYHQTITMFATCAPASAQTLGLRSTFCSIHSKLDLAYVQQTLSHELSVSWRTTGSHRAFAWLRVLPGRLAMVWRPCLGAQSVQVGQIQIAASGSTLCLHRSFKAENPTLSMKPL